MSDIYLIWIALAYNVIVCLCNVAGGITAWFSFEKQTFWMHFIGLPLNILTVVVILKELK